jgi:hypothetical protein
VVIPVGALVIRGLVRREITRRWQAPVLWAFALFPIPATILANPAYKGYERARNWVAAGRQRRDAGERLRAAAPDHGAWSYVEDGTSRVLDSGPDAFTIRDSPLQACSRPRPPQGRDPLAVRPYL